MIKYMKSCIIYQITQNVLNPQTPPEEEPTFQVKPERIGRQDNAPPKAEATQKRKAQKTQIGFHDAESDVRLPGPERQKEREMPRVMIIKDTRYMLVDVMGRGGMGTAALYEKMDDPLHTKNTLDRWMVVKRAESRDKDDREKLPQTMEHEVAINAQIAGTRDKVAMIGLEYIVIPWKQGCPMNSLRLNGRISTETTLLFSYKLVKTLLAAHEKRVIHTDVKPGNTVITPDGTVELIDFGLGRNMDAVSSPYDNDVAGSPEYMAPEQWKQEPITSKTDVYAVGVMLHEMLTDSRLVDATSLHDYVKLAFQNGLSEQKKGDEIKWQGYLAEKLSSVKNGNIGTILKKMLITKAEDRISMEEAAQLLERECRLRGVDPESALFDPVTKELPLDPRMPLLNGMEDDFRHMPLDPADDLNPIMFEKAMLDADEKRYKDTEARRLALQYPDARPIHSQDKHGITEGEESITFRNGMAI